jgi:altronate hydrolase
VKNNALRLDANDNIVIATRPITKGEAVVVDGRRLFNAAEDIDAGHKIALFEMTVGANVIRYGEPIVQATRLIAKGQWVHVHNTRPIPGDLKE